MDDSNNAVLLYTTISGLDGHIAIYSCPSLSQSFGDSFFELAIVQNLDFVVWITIKVKERIVLSEIHLRTTGRHLSMGSHSAICHPTEVSVSECSFLMAHQHKKAI